MDLRSCSHLSESLSIACRAISTMSLKFKVALLLCFRRDVLPEQAMGGLDQHLNDIISALIRLDFNLH